MSGGIDDPRLAEGALATPAWPTKAAPRRDLSTCAAALAKFTDIRRA
jgi:hypothetical protein